MHDQASASIRPQHPNPQTTPDDGTQAASSRTPALSPAGGGISRVPSQTSPETEKCAPWAADTRFPPAPNDTISMIRNILLTNPLFPKFYADVVLTYRPKSREAKILRPWYRKILEKVNWEG